ncbi:hypothetical protein [Bradyrhizobium sp. Ai1a-2]|uniref:hypothetical protein n=1 Tax=Bradyrhizobium sp. Ai1a-2 TaxID=196490 RepID=UPI00042481FC|nr:hypothetical protein [Bradyrhizobium sp. Ai1a-2]
MAAAVAGVVVAGVVLGAALRATGRDLGNGTFGSATASAIATSPKASTSDVAKAVDRNAAARGEGVTAFLCGGESSDR